MDTPPLLNLPPLLARCPRCGATVAGRFCSQCGASLDLAEGSLGGEIKSKFLDPISGLFGFLKAAWLLIVRPTDFCRAWLLGPQGMAQLTFPLAGLWRRLSRGAQNIVPPFQALAFGLGLIAAGGAIEAASWKLAGLQALRQEADRRQEEGIQQASRYYYGHDVKIVKLSELTGLAPLDAALDASFQLIDYLAFAVLIALLMPRMRLAHPRAIFQYFALAVAVGLAVRTAAVTVAAALFIPLAGGSLQTALGAETVVVFVGYLPMIWFGAFLPIVVFPRVVPLSRLRAVGAVFGGLAAMAVINAIRSQVMLQLGIIFV